VKFRPSSSPEPLCGRSAAALLDVLDGRFYGAAAASFLRAAEEPLAPLRIRLGLTSPFASVDPEVEAAVRRAAACLQALGHHVEDGSPLPVTDLAEFLPIMGR
jgi:Asp-tRNA(Asn)/Glu-tRNA(Gln) amidotransferase A subunit family amidase